MSTTETEPRTVDPEPELDDEATDETADEPAAELEPNPDAGELFDRSHYDREDLAIPAVDGEGIDRIRIRFTGSVMLDRSAPADVALFNRLRLSKEVELRVAGRVSGVSTGYTTGKDGDLDAVVGERTVKVETVWVLDPENLSS
jgi:hypothetical protein